MSRAPPQVARVIGAALCCVLTLTLVAVAELTGGDGARDARRVADIVLALAADEARLCVGVRLVTALACFVAQNVRRPTAWHEGTCLHSDAGSASGHAASRITCAREPGHRSRHPVRFRDGPTPRQEGEKARRNGSISFSGFRFIFFDFVLQISAASGYYGAHTLRRSMVKS